MAPLFSHISNETIDSATFSRLRRLYVLALGAIALAIVSGQLLIQDHLRKQTDDSRVVNVAGRQRMLSQRITKQVLLFAAGAQPDSLRNLRQQLRKDIWVWHQAHQGLQAGDLKLGLPGYNSTAIRAMFREVNPHFEAMYGAVRTIADASTAGQSRVDSNLLAQVLRNEKRFVAEMDQIVFQYDAESKAKVNEIKRIEWILLLVALFILLVEFWFIFRPAAIHVREALQRLLHSSRKPNAWPKKWSNCTALKRVRCKNCGRSLLRWIRRPCLPTAALRDKCATSARSFGNCWAEQKPCMVARPKSSAPTRPANRPSMNASKKRARASAPAKSRSAPAMAASSGWRCRSSPSAAAAWRKIC
ncbi:MAG: type IV pili methyl-accepting chemotaxis transducer N-terminal domain-containing protein [Haliscomenobacter sp.]|nr:type IV pili methyl-accepting chemotaxis transducer N-terminal domain-containing protein [Haliscomenobacter sp.]